MTLSSLTFRISFFQIEQADLSFPEAKEIPINTRSWFFFTSIAKLLISRSRLEQAEAASSLFLN